MQNADATGGGGGGGVGMTAMALAQAQGQSKRNSAFAPEVVVMPPPEGEPLLAPGRVAAREGSPGGVGRERSVSPGLGLGIGGR